VSHRPRPTDPPGPVRAAGAICWRHGDGGGLELLLVRSARWGDWSWPKGKLEPGETLPECAVREVAEETGARIELGVPLSSISYVLPDGQPKTVSYWAGRVRSTGPRTALDDEISDVEWLPAAAARKRLTRPGDHVLLDQVLELAERHQLDTRPLLVVRHAKARSRAHWGGGEGERPLTSAGRRQAQGLAGLLACWQPERLLCSPWARCMQTLRPYLDQRDKVAQQDHYRHHRSGRPPTARSEPEVLPLLSEQGLRNDPARIGVTIDELLGERRSALICTHRPVLAPVIESLARVASEQVRNRLPDADPWLTPAEILVAHIYSNRSHNVTDQIHTVERFRGESSRTSLR
jgi:8-oxo-dGTP pyrophosphatase MutT (NUDIX family)